MEDSIVSFEDLSSSSFRSALNEYRISGKFTDLTLKTIDGHQIKVHKNVVGASCTYFSGMFNDFKESNQGEVELSHEFNMEILKIVIDYFYTGKIKFSSGLSPDFFKIAQFLGLTGLQEFCTEVLKSTMTLENCLERLRFAGNFLNDELKSAATEMIKVNYRKFLTRFCTDLNFDELKSITNGIDLRPVPEFAFEIFHRWFKVDSESRQQQFNNLWSYLDFSQMSKEFIQAEILKDELLKENSLLIWEVLTTAVKKLPSPVFPVNCLNILSNEGIHEVGLAPENSFTTKLKFEKKLSAFSDVAFKNFIYVAEDESFSAVNLWTGNVESLPRMNRERYLHSSIELNGKIYCCGGEANRVNLRTVEIFDTSSSSWTVGPDMNETKCEFGLCATDNCIYAFGGPEGRQLEYLDPREGEWKIICADSTDTYKSILFKDKSIYCCCYDDCSKLFDLRANKWGEKLARVGYDPYCLNSFDVINLNEKFYATYQSTKDSKCRFFELDETTMEWTPLGDSHLLAADSSIKFFGCE